MILYFLFIVYRLLITMPPKKKPVNVSNKTKPAIVTVRKSSRTTPVKNKEKVNNILSLLFPCYYQLYAYSRVRNLNLPLLNKLRFLFFEFNEFRFSVSPANFRFLYFLFVCLLIFPSHWIFPNFKLKSLLTFFFFLICIFSFSLNFSQL